VIQLRRATAADLEIVADWIDSPDAARLWAGSRVAWPIARDRLADAIEWSQCESFALDERDERHERVESAPGEGVRLVAFGQLVPKPNDRLHMARLIVAPERRGAGVGRGLVSQIVDIALSRSPTALSLNVISGNDHALRLYEGQGFVPARRPPDEPDSSTAVYLEFSMPQAPGRSA